jgi:predicted ATPase
LFFKFVETQTFLQIMRALLKNTYKSLEPFESEELSNFTVITGKNGSGKSQLLDLIMKKSQHDQTVLGIDLVFEPRLSKVQMEGIAKLGTVTVNSQK